MIDEHPPRTEEHEQPDDPSHRVLNENDLRSAMHRRHASKLFDPFVEGYECACVFTVIIIAKLICTSFKSRLSYIMFGIGAPSPTSYF